MKVESLHITLNRVRPFKFGSIKLS